MATTHAEPLADLTGFQRDLVAAVKRLDEPHGLGIKAELEHWYEKEIHHGRLYPNLDTLVEKGLVIKSAKDDRTNEYRLSARGRRAHQAHVAWMGDDGE